MHTQVSPSETTNLSVLSYGVIGLGLATAIIHATLIPAEFEKGATGYGTLFILTALGYFLCLVAMYLPSATLDPVRTPARVVLVCVAIVAIAAYLILGYFDTLGWVTKAIESLLLVFVFAEHERWRGRRVGITITSSNIDTAKAAIVLAGGTPHRE